MQNAPREEDLILVAILHALSDETRLLIIERLVNANELTCKLCAPEGPRSSLSHHFQVLRSSGVLATRKDGTTLLNSLRKLEIDRRFPGLLDAVLSARKVPGRNERALVQGHK